MPRQPLIETLRSGGQVDSSGEFSVDGQGALEKMRQFQLLDPRDYVLNLVQAGVALGAEEIDFRLDGRRCVVLMKGVLLPPEVLKQPLSFLFVHPEKMELEGYRELAIALCAAQSLRPSRVQVTSAGFVAQVRDTDTQAVPTPDGGNDTRVEVTLPPGLRQILGSDVQVQTKALRDRAGYCPVPLLLNGERLTPPAMQRPFLERSNDIEIWLGERPGQVQFVKHGVEICERSLKLKTPTASALVFADHLLKNVSGSDMVEDDRYMQILGELDRACDRWLTKAAGEYLGAVPRLQARLRLQLLQSLANHDVDDASSGLLGLPIFETVNGQSQSVHDLQRYLSTHKKLRTIGDVPLREDVTRMVVRLREPWAHLALENVLGRSLVPVKELDGKKARPLPLPGADYLVTWPFQEKGYTGHLGILREADPYALVTCWTRDQLVVEKRWAAVGVSYRMALQHRRSEWKDPELLDIASEVVEDACCWLAQTVRPPHPEMLAVQRVLLAWLAGHSDRPPPAAMQDYPLFETSEGRLVSWLDLKRDQEQFGAVHVALGAEAGTQSAGRHVVVDGNAALVLRQLFPKVIDYRARLQQQSKAQTPSAQPAAAPLFPVTLTRGNVSIVVGVASDRSGSRRRWDTAIRFQAGGAVVQTRSVALEFGPLDVTAVASDFAGGITEAHVQTVLAALREGCGPLADKVAEALINARDWQQDRMREFLVRYLTWKGEVPESLMDAPLFIGLGRVAVSVRQLRAGSTVRYVSNDVGAFEVQRPVLVCSRATADVVSRMVRRPPENWEQGLSDQLLYQSYLMRPAASTRMADPCFHVETVQNGRIGFLPPSSAFNGQSEVRIVWHGRLLDTVTMATPVPVDAIVTDDSLASSPNYDAVQRDDNFDRTLQAIRAGLEIGIESLFPRHGEEPVRDTLLSWGLSQCQGRESILLSGSQSRLGRLARLPLLTSTLGRPAALRDVAAQDRCFFVALGETALPVDADVVVSLSPLHQAWMTPVFDMHSVAMEAQVELSSDPLLRKVQECLAAYPPSRPLCSRVRMGQGNGLVSLDDSTGIATVHRSHPLIQEAETVPKAAAVLAAIVYSTLDPGSVQKELDFLMHVANWLGDGNPGL